MKYKVGDKVLIKNDLIIGGKYGEQTFVTEMSAFLGKEVTIGCVFYGKYNIEECPNGWFWTDDMIEELTPKGNTAVDINYCRSNNTLDTGDIVRLRDGSFGIIYVGLTNQEGIIMFESKEPLSLSGYLSNMKSTTCRELDIVSLYRLKNLSNIGSYNIDDYESLLQIEKEVDFMSAIRLFNDCNDIYCINQFGETKEYNSNRLDDVFFLEDDILNSTWYISKENRRKELE